MGVVGEATLEAANREIAALKTALEKKDDLHRKRVNAMSRRISVLEGENTGGVAALREGRVALEEGLEALEAAREDGERLRQQLALEATRVGVLTEMLRAQRQNPNGLYGCTLCLRAFRLVTRKPYVMACGHSFCQHCLVEWANATRGVERDLQRRRVANLPQRREFARVNRILEHTRDEEEEEATATVPMEQMDQAPIGLVVEEIDEVFILD
ncbi:unnamed protein product [Caenorhabditis brenneri]